MRSIFVAVVVVPSLALGLGVSNIVVRVRGGRGDSSRFGGGCNVVSGVGTFSVAVTKGEDELEEGSSGPQGDNEDKGLQRLSHRLTSGAHGDGNGHALTTNSNTPKIHSWMAA